MKVGDTAYYINFQYNGNPVLHTVKIIALSKTGTAKLAPLGSHPAQAYAYVPRAYVALDALIPDLAAAQVEYNERAKKRLAQRREEADKLEGTLFS